MDYKRAAWIWNNSTFDSLGVDGNGEEVTKITTFGAIVLGAKVPTSLPIVPRNYNLQQLEEVKNFLVSLAAAIESEIYRVNQEA